MDFKRRSRWARDILLEEAAQQLTGGLIPGPTYSAKELFSTEGQLGVFQKDILKHACATGRLVKVGGGRSTRYTKPGRNWEREHGPLPEGSEKFRESN